MEEERVPHEERATDKKKRRQNGRRENAEREREREREKEEKEMCLYFCTIVHFDRDSHNANTKHKSLLATTPFYRYSLAGGEIGKGGLFGIWFREKERGEKRAEKRRREIGKGGLFIHCCRGKKSKGKKRRGASGAE